MSPYENNMLGYCTASENNQNIFLVISNDWKPVMSRRNRCGTSPKAGSTSNGNRYSDSPVLAEEFPKLETCFWRKTLHHSTTPSTCLNLKPSGMELFNVKKPMVKYGNYDWFPHYHSVSLATSDVEDDARTIKCSESTHKRNVNFKFHSDLRFEPTTYASMLKKPLNENTCTVEDNPKGKDVANGFTKMQLPVHHACVRLGFPLQGKMSTASPQIIRTSTKTDKRPQNKMDYLRELVGSSNLSVQSNNVGSATLDSPQSKRTLSIVASMHPVNSLSRPAGSANIGCANSHIAFIMGFSPCSDSSDSDDSADECDFAPCKISTETHKSEPPEGTTTKRETSGHLQQSTSSHNNDADVSKEFRFRIDSSTSDLDAVNLRWQCAYPDDKDFKVASSKKVSFASDLDLETVHSTSPECRKSPWEEFARDRFRFQRRIHETGLVLNRILQDDHRRKIYETNILPYI